MVGFGSGSPDMIAAKSAEHKERASYRKKCFSRIVVTWRQRRSQNLDILFTTHTSLTTNESLGVYKRIGSHIVSSAEVEFK